MADFHGNNKVIKFNPIFFCSNGLCAQNVPQQHDATSCRIMSISCLCLNLRGVTFKSGCYYFVQYQYLNDTWIRIPMPERYFFDTILHYYFTKEYFSSFLIHLSWNNQVTFFYAISNPTRIMALLLKENLFFSPIPVVHKPFFFDTALILFNDYQSQLTVNH